MEEVWKDIEEYEGLYQVSNLGRVKSLNRYIISSNGKTLFYKEKILKLRKNKHGYLYVFLYKNTVQKFYTIHRLVANAFIENPNNYPCINHKDENKENNKVSNLEWCTYLYNNTYGTRIERIIKSQFIPIYCLETNKCYNSIKQASEELNLDRTNIVNALRGRQKQTKGYTFRYVSQVLYRG